MAAAAVVLVLISFGFKGVIAAVLAPVAAPLVGAGTWMSSRLFWWTQARRISPQELETLRVQGQEHLVQTAQLEQVRQENASLRAQLEFVERTKVDVVAAKILSKRISHMVSRFVIDAGADDGIEAGAAVLAQEGIYLGKVTDVGARASTVTALGDPTHSVAVSLLNESRTIGVASGAVGDLLRIDFIPVDETIEVGELVVTSGLEDAVESGLLVGVVNAIVQEPGSAFQQAVVEPLADIRRLTSVLVLRLNPTAP